MDSRRTQSDPHKHAQLLADKSAKAVPWRRVRLLKMRWVTGHPWPNTAMPQSHVLNKVLK